MIKAPFFHLGVVVENIEKAMTELGAALDLEWRSVQRFDATIERPSGPKLIEIAFAYSVQGPPYFELLERRDDTPWSQEGPHHIGVWGSEVRSESRRLSRLGCPRETVLLTPEGAWRTAPFHSTSSGLMIEIVDEAPTRPRLERYLAGGNFIDVDSDGHAAESD